MIHNKYFEILKEFLGDYNRELYGRELIGKVTLGQKNIALTLNDLENLGILSSKMKGNIRFYFLNKQNSLIDKYLMLAEIHKSIGFLDKHKKIKTFLEGISFSGIVCIFGSYAKGIEKTNSDLDLFVIGSSDEKELTSEGEKFGIDISIKSGTKKDFKEMIESGNPLMKEILENHVVVFGFEEFVCEVLKNG